jgi:hypothetical protein
MFDLAAFCAATTESSVDLLDMLVPVLVGRVLSGVGVTCGIKWCRCCSMLMMVLVFCRVDFSVTRAWFWIS